jgi:hypothetical protein
MSKVVTVDGEQYSIGKLDAMKQFHLARRLSPILAALVKGMKDLDLRDVQSAFGETNGDGGENSKFVDLFRKFLEGSAEPVAEALAQMEDAQAENIIYPCMAVVARAQANNWAPVKVAGANRLMFDDITGMTLIKLTIAVIRENLGSFTFGAGAGSAQEQVLSR